MSLVTERIVGDIYFNREDGTVSEPVRCGFAYSNDDSGFRSITVFGEEVVETPKDIEAAIEGLIQSRRMAQQIIKEWRDTSG